MFRIILTIKLIILCSTVGNAAVLKQNNFSVNSVVEKQFTRQNVTSISQDSEGYYRIDETETLTDWHKLPFWQKMWFQILFVVIIIILIWILIRYGIVQRAKLNQKLETQTKELTEQKVEIEAQKETIQQQTDALERSKRKLVELNEDKKHMIGLLSHDLRAPLATVLGAVQLFKTDPDLPKDQQMKMFGMLEEMMIKHLQIVSKIVEIDSIESGKIKLQLESVDVVEATKELILRFKEKAKKKEIEVSLNTPDEKFYIIADKNYLIDRIFGNLLSNALSFSPSRSEVEILVQRDNNKLMWCVKDEGPGISEKDKKLLFVKYQKLSARPTGGESSTGLGLSIVKRLVDEMNGRVWCESEGGKGAAFWVEFPLDVNNGSKVEST